MRKITTLNRIGIFLFLPKLSNCETEKSKLRTKSVYPKLSSTFIKPIVDTRLFLYHFKNNAVKNVAFLLFAICFITNPTISNAQTTLGGVNMGNLTDYFMVFTDGNVDANWQGASKGFVGNVVIDGIQANERTSGTVPYSGTLYTNDVNLGAWQNIVNSNSGQATGSYNNTTLINTLTNSLESCFSQINALTVTSGYEGVSSTSLNGLNTQNGTTEIYVINITSGFSVSSKINIRGDASDVFFLRWDSDANFSDGYEGEVKFQSGGAIVPLGGLLACNFIHVAGDINSSGGGSNPSAPYPQGPRHVNGTGNLITNGSNFNGGGFFTGYWLTTGSPTIAPGGVQPYGETGSLSNAIFVGGWYSKTTKFSMTSGTSGVYVNVQTALPVTWLNISALRSINGLVKVNWATASEINNDFFTIEKSSDDRNFVEVANIDGAGNKSTISKYVFEDANPGVGTIYYRIKQTDYNGEFAYSAIVAVNPGKLLNNVTMNPNPASSNVTLTWDAGIKEQLTCQVTDLSGVVLRSEPLSTSNNIHFLNLQEMNNGLYLINIVSNNDMVYRSRIVVAR